MDNSRIPHGNGQQPQVPIIGQPPRLHSYDIFLRAPGLPEQRIATLQAPDIRGAALIFLAQIGGDLTPIREFKIQKQDGGIITPA